MINEHYHFKESIENDEYHSKTSAVVFIHCLQNRKQFGKF